MTCFCFCRWRSCVCCCVRVNSVVWRSRVLRNFTATSSSKTLASFTCLNCMWLCVCVLSCVLACICVCACVRACVWVGVHGWACVRACVGACAWARACMQLCAEVQVSEALCIGAFCCCFFSSSHFSFRAVFISTVQASAGLYEHNVRILHFSIDALTNHRLIGAQQLYPFCVYLMRELLSTYPFLVAVCSLLFPLTL